MKKDKCKCRFCHKLFPRSPRHTNQDCCKDKDCQRAKKREWQKNKMKNDPDYKSNQEDCRKRWKETNPDYWKEYRKKNPHYVERNRMLQRLRNLKRKCIINDKNQIQRPIININQIANMDSSTSFKICFIDPPKQKEIVKMDTSTPNNSFSNIAFSGIYYLLPVIA